MTTSRGFTLVEILVAITIFMILMGGIFGVSIYALRTNSNSIAQEQLLDQTGSAMEYMSRMVRMAKKSDGALGCIGATLNYDFNVSDPTYVKFIKSEGTTNNCIKFSKDSSDPADMHIDAEVNGEITRITSDDINVTDLKFKVLNTEAGKQPEVVILIVAQSKSGNPKPSIRLETIVSQRDLNIAL